MTQNLIDNNTQQIIKRYTIIYKAIFQYSIYFIPFILAIIWAWSLQSSSVIARTQIPKETKFPSFAVEDGIYKAARISDEVGPIFDGFGNIKILGGELQTTGNIIIGRNNLILLGGTNGGIVLPNRPYIINMGFTGGLEYFTNKDYDINQLKWVMDNRILSLAPTANESTTGASMGIDAMFYRSKEKKNQTPTNMEQVLNILQQKNFFDQYAKGIIVGEDPSITAAKDKFIIENKLTCLFKFRIISIFCDINLNKVIKLLPEIALDNYLYDLVQISKKITKKDQIDSFCSNLMINILRKPYPNTELDKIMQGTCKAYDNRYERLKVFLGVQNEIETIVSENVIGTDVEFNLFKLISIQQKIYAQHKDKTLETSLVTSYLGFLNNLINDKNIKIPQFYIEEAYYFNNIYLRNILRKTVVETINPSTQDEVNKQLNIISSINKGNPSIGVIGLDSLIINSSLKKNINTFTGSLFPVLQDFDNAFEQMIKSFPELKPTSLQTDDNGGSARFIGIIRSVSTEEINPVPAIIDFLYKDGRFSVTSIRTPQNQDTDKVVQAYIKKNKMPALGVLIYLVQSNTELTNPNLGMCNILLSTSMAQKILQCSETAAKIDFVTETITFTIKNNVIISGIGSNPKRQTLIDSLINNKNITQDRVNAVLESLNKAIQKEKEIKDDDTSSPINQEKISIIEKFEKFLGITPSLVVKKDNKRLVSFTLNDYEFAGIIDIKNNYKLSPLVVQAGGKNITISAFSLSLINLQQKRITEFVEDPILFIKGIDVNKYNQIIQLQKPSVTE